MTDYRAEERQTDDIADAQTHAAGLSMLCECGATLFRVTDSVYFCFACDIYEDTLPANITESEYDEWFKRSWVDGVRIGPRFVRIENNPPPISDAEIKAAIERVHQYVASIGQPNYPVRADDEQPLTD